MAYDGNPFLLTDTQIAAQKVGDRSFIDLSFDGTAISDFGLVVVFDGQTQNEYLTPQFTNNNTTIPGRDGLIIWKTNINSGTLSRTLATEQMSSRQYNAFKQWLKPGKVAKLILAQRPYCYAWAMLESVPQFNFVPFEKQIEIDNETYYDTIYRGSAQVTWTLVQPYWYGFDLSTIADYKKQSWIFESGLPLTLSSDVLYANSSYQSIANYNNFKVYNSGNMDSKCSIKFIVAAGTYTISNSKINWHDITVLSNGIAQTIIGQPRAFSDVDYTLALANQYGESFLENKTKIINNLIENLDSNSVFRGQLMHEVNRAQTVSDLTEWLKELIETSTYIFTIDSENHEMIMKASMPKALHWDQQNPSTYQDNPLEMDQNIEGASNGKYITIAGNKQLTRTFDIHPITMSISSSTELSQCQIYFLNEYV